MFTGNRLLQGSYQNFIEFKRKIFGRTKTPKTEPQTTSQKECVWNIVCKKNDWKKKNRIGRQNSKENPVGTDPYKEAVCRNA